MLSDLAQIIINDGATYEARKLHGLNCLEGAVPIDHSFAFWQAEVTRAARRQRLHHRVNYSMQELLEAVQELYDYYIQHAREL